MSYRADTAEEYSNQYHLSGSVPSSDANWLTLIDALIAQEKTIYPSNTVVVRAYGYDSDAEDATAVYVKDYLAGGGSGTPGTLTVGTNVRCPGDAAVWVRWGTSRFNSRGKRIYLRKYFHPAYSSGASTPDIAISAQLTALGNFGVKMRDASFAESRTIRSRLHAETIVGSAAGDYITTRTLKRRGKRPPT